MPRFSLNKVDHYPDTQNLQKNITNFKLSSGQEPQQEELLVFVVDDDPHFLQILNTHFSKLELQSEQNKAYRFQVKNFTTGKSCISDLGLNPDLIILNYYINKGLPDALKGKEILHEIADTNPNQKVLILNDMHVNLRDAFVENGLRDYIIKDHEALTELNRLVVDMLNR